MQSSLVAVLAVLATGVCAGPLNPLFGRATCDVKNCVVALAPSFPTACDPAATQLGANTPFNTACLAAAAKGTAAFPTSCAPCAAQFGVTDPGKKTPGTTNGGATANAPNTNGPNTNTPTAQDANTNGASRNGTPANGAATNTRPAPRANGKKAPLAPPAPARPAPAPAPPAPVPAAPKKGKPAARANKAAPAPAPAPAAPAPAPGAPAPPAPKKAKNGKAPAPARPRASVCDIQACVIALEPSFPLCAPAVMQLGANTSFNGNCLVGAAKGTTPFPTACGGCAAQFGVTEPGSNTNTNANTQSPAPVGDGNEAHTGTVRNLANLAQLHWIHALLAQNHDGLPERRYSVGKSYNYSSDPGGGGYLQSVGGYRRALMVQWKQASQIGLKPRQ
ncbi:hypothetical protein B0H13DRAFT_1900332 [Mycena leptocephala]|nr:hypothetical protein B0H13DRAFT_1900332 [Mycena leptocephala]